jgi:xanthine dehydrogenase molybdopterin-binding subunit B
MVRVINLYKKGDTTPTGEVLNDFNVNILIDNLLQSSDYNNRLAQVNEFNKNNRSKKKGLSFTCLSWEAFWTNRIII